MPRTYDEECSYIERVSEVQFRIKKGFVPNMNVEGRFYVNKALEKLMFEELRNACRSDGIGGFLPAVRQVGNVAALPAIVSLLIPNPRLTVTVRSGSVANHSCCDSEPLSEVNNEGAEEQLAQSLFDHIPVGVGSKGIIPIGAQQFEVSLP
uniref:3'-phosphate/5'-hydroxy nucleic acid ligase n=1 Tax=Parascaris equorum TaxID=6256 RepID=A0A914RD66_PAREQ